MSAGLYITKKGFKLVEWDGDVCAYVDKQISNILHELRSTCYIEKDVTLGDIISIVADDKLLTALINKYSWCDVKAFYTELRKPIATRSDLNAIEISRYIEIHKGHKTDIPTIEETMNVSGCDDEHSNWAIDFVPVNEIAHVPVRLNNLLKIYDFRGENGISTLVEGTTCFSLLEVLSEIFYEISFHGSPSSRNDRMNELLIAVEEIKSGETSQFIAEPEKDTIQ
jgi:hypothetical protein